jgi:hypothetical protein
LIDEGITVTDVIEKADKIQNYPQSSDIEEQQLSLAYIDDEKITNENHPLTLLDK